MTIHNVKTILKYKPLLIDIATSSSNDEHSPSYMFSMYSLVL